MRRNKPLIRVLAFALAISLFPGAFPGKAQAYGAAEPELSEGYIMVRNEESGLETRHAAYLDEKEEMIFCPLDNLAVISGYQETESKGGRRFVKSDGFSGFFVEFYPDGKVKTQWEDYKIPVRRQEQEVYYSLPEALYLMGTQWAVTDDEGKEYSDDAFDPEEDVLFLQVFPRQSNIMDFFDEYLYELNGNKIGPSDVLTNNEKSEKHEISTSLAAIFNDFDGRIWVPFFGAKWLIEEEFQEALVSLASDEVMAEEDVFMAAVAKISSAGFEGIKTGWSYVDGAVKTASPVLNMAGDSEGLLNLLEEASEKIPSVRFRKANDLSKLKPDTVKTFFKDADDLAKGAGVVSDLISVADAMVQIHEANTRSEKWSEDYIRQIEILAEIENDPFEGEGKKIKKAAKKVKEEYEEPSKAAKVEALAQVGKFIVGKGAEITFAGTLAGMISGGLAVAKMNPSLKASIEMADLSYMVDCLMKIENMANWELGHVYSDAVEKMKKGETLSQKEIEKLRDAGLLALRVNQKFWEYMYQIHEVAEKDEYWKNGSEAYSIRENIAWDAAMAAALTSTEEYDDALKPVKIKDLYSSEFGKQRSEIVPELWNESETAENNGGNVVRYKGNTYYWKYSGASFYSPGTFAYYPYIQETANELICRRKDGSEEVLLTAKGNGPIFITGERIYLQSDGANLFSVNLDGSGRAEHGTFEPWAADEKSGTLIGRRSYADGGGVALLKADHTLETITDTGYTFLGTIDGYCYYTSAEYQDMPQFTLYRVSLDGSQVEELDSVTKDAGEAMGLDVCQIAKLGNTIYYSYGFYAGTGGYFQDGGINCVDIDGSNKKVCVEYGSLRAEEFMVEEKDGQALVYYIGDENVMGSYVGYWDDYPYNNCFVKNMADSTVQQSKFPLSSPGTYVCIGGDILLAGNNTTVYTEAIPKEAGFGFIDSPTGSEEELVLISSLDVVEGELFFTVDWSRRSRENDFGWRPGYIRDHSAFYTMKIGDKKAEEIYSY